MKNQPFCHIENQALNQNAFFPKNDQIGRLFENVLFKVKVFLSFAHKFPCIKDFYLKKKNIFHVYNKEIKISYSCWYCVQVVLFKEINANG